jgi:hypothetical protein
LTIRGPVPSRERCGTRGVLEAESSRQQTDVSAEADFVWRENEAGEKD